MANEYLAPNELLKVLAQAKERGARDFCMFVMAYLHGLRAQEICNLRMQDVRNGTIDVRRVKGSERTIQNLKTHENHLLNEVAALDEWLKVRGDADGSQFLFTSRQGSGLTRRQIYNLFEDCAFKAGIGRGRRNPHQLKHAFCSHTIRAGVGIEYVQKAVGHKDIGSTQFYLHIQQSEAADKVDSALAGIFA